MNTRVNLFALTGTRKPPFFTLIELLVVIAIISILAAMLLPALGRARDMAGTTACLSQTKQIGLLLVQYADDSNGCVPFSWQWDHRASPASPHFVWSDMYSSANPGMTWLDPLWDYTGTPTVFQCQRQKRRQSGTKFYAGYTYNYLIGGGHAPGQPSQARGSYGDAACTCTPAQHLAQPYRLQEIQNPERKMHVACGSEGDRGDGAYMVGHPQGSFYYNTATIGSAPYQWETWPSGHPVKLNRHESGCPVLFVAGNARTLGQNDDFGVPLTQDGALRAVRETKWLDPRY